MAQIVKYKNNEAFVMILAGFVLYLLYIWQIVL